MLYVSGICGGGGGGGGGDGNSVCGGVLCKRTSCVVKREGVQKYHCSLTSCTVKSSADWLVCRQILARCQGR